jgi:hypothetical protein
VAIWVGYDNADGKRRTLGGGATGGHVAVPIFESVIQAVSHGLRPHYRSEFAAERREGYATCQSRQEMKLIAYLLFHPDHARCHRGSQLDAGDGVRAMAWKAWMKRDIWIAARHRFD